MATIVGCVFRIPTPRRMPVTAKINTCLDRGSLLTFHIHPKKMLKNSKPQTAGTPAKMVFGKDVCFPLFLVELCCISFKLPKIAKKKKSKLLLLAEVHVFFWKQTVEKILLLEYFPLVPTFQVLKQETHPFSC